MNGFIEAGIARGNRNLLLTGLGALALWGVLAALLDGSWGMFLVIAVPGLVTLAVWLKRVLDPKAHPLYRELARYGDRNLLAEQVNREFAKVTLGDRAEFGAAWLAQRDKFRGLRLVPWAEVAWLHVWVLKGTGTRSHSVQVWSRDGRSFLCSGGSEDEQAARRLLQDLRARAPWAEVGYSPELVQDWQRRRSQFLARVDQRRAQGAAARGESAGAAV